MLTLFNRREVYVTQNMQKTGRGQGHSLPWQGLIIPSK